MVGMTRGLVFVVAAVLGVALVGAPGCKTDTPGVKSSYRAQWATVDGDTREATQAAEAVLKDLDLRDVKATSTRLDGEVIGYRADGTKITVTVKRLTEDTSEVSVYSGRLGDPEVGKDVVARIQDRLND